MPKLTQPTVVPIVHASVQQRSKVHSIQSANGWYSTSGQVCQARQAVETVAEAEQLIAQRATGGWRSSAQASRRIPLAIDCLRKEIRREVRWPIAVCTSIEESPLAENRVDRVVVLFVRRKRRVGVLKTVAFALGLQERVAVSQSVEGGPGQWLTAQCLGPILEPLSRSS